MIHFKFWQVDGLYQNTSFQVLNHDSYFMNLTDANAKKSIEWVKEYNAKVSKNIYYTHNWVLINYEIY